MPMRLSGLMSGMDTESIVAQLVETRKAKVTKAVKAQKSLKYKQDAWKDLNKKILNLYNKSLSNMRFESSFVKKTTKVSNSSVVSVITGENAMNSVQSLTVDKLAKTAYLTGGEIKLSEDAESTEITGNTKLRDLGFTTGANGNMTVTVDGEKKYVSVTADMTVNSFVSQLREAGLSANFDEGNGRIHIAAKASGSEHNFEIQATNVAGLEALTALKLNYSNVSFSDPDKVKADGIAAKVQDELNNYSNALATQKNLTESLLKYKDVINEKLAQNNSGFTVEQFFSGTNTITEDQLKEIEIAIADGVADAGKNSNLAKDLTGWTDKWKKNETALGKMNPDNRFNVDADGKVSWKDDAAKAAAEQRATDEVNALLKAQNDLVVGKKTEAHKQDGANAQITLNGVTYTSSRNTFEVNGLTLTATAETKGEEVTITTEDDISGIYDMVKNFIKEYSTLINEMDKLYNADSAKGYDPLTDEEKEAMSDSAIEEWENKIKDSILRKDGTLGNFASEMKRIMMEGVEVNGKQMYLSNFGIGTLSYFSAAENEKNAYHIDGDPDDESTSGNPDKLKSMIANDPDTVVSFFTQLSKNLYSQMFDMMKGVEGVSSSMTAYEDKRMQSDYDDYTVKIKELEDKLADYEDKWYAKFAAMETALAKMQNNASAVTSLLGG